MENDNYQHLADIAEVLEMAKTRGWALVCGFIEEYVSEAERAMHGNQSSDDKVTANLTRRWRERNEMAIRIIDFIASCNAERQQLIENEEQPDAEFLQ